MKLLLPCVLALGLTACNDPTSFGQRTLPLREVDGAALPATLPSGTGTVQVVSGRLVSTLQNDECTWTLNFSGGTTRTGTVMDCVLFLDENFTLTLDLGGPPAPTGPHDYEFGVDPS